MPGARLLETEGEFSNLLAFVNPDNKIVIVIRNDEKQDKSIRIKIGDKEINPLLKADSFNTLVINWIGS